MPNTAASHAITEAENFSVTHKRAFIMISNYTDIHPTPEGQKLRDHVTSSRAHGRKHGGFLFFRGFVLLLPFFIQIKQSVSEIASCTFYYHAIRSCTRVFYEQRLCCLWRLSAKKAIESSNRDSRRLKNDHISYYIVCSLNPYGTPKMPKWYKCRFQGHSNLKLGISEK